MVRKQPKSVAKAAEINQRTRLMQKIETFLHNQAALAFRTEKPAVFERGLKRYPGLMDDFLAREGRKVDKDDAVDTGIHMFLTRKLEELEDLDNLPAFYEAFVKDSSNPHKKAAELHEHILGDFDYDKYRGFSPYKHSDWERTTALNKAGEILIPYMDTETKHDITRQNLSKKYPHLTYLRTIEEQVCKERKQQQESISRWIATLPVAEPSRQNALPDKKQDRFLHRVKDLLKLKRKK
jgi:hypothetical protein